MGTIQLQATIPQAADDAWRTVSDLESAKHLTNMIAEVVVGEGSRVCTTADGASIVERIISTDDELRRQAYTVTEGPFGHEHHNASMQVFEADGGSRLVWTIDLLPDALAEGMQEPMEAEFATIVERLRSIIG